MKTDFNIGCVKVRIIDRGKYITVWIPGTNDFWDLLITAQCWSWDGMHFGCRTKAMEIYHSDEFDELVLSNDKPLEFAGHSMGGSIAESLADMLPVRTFSVVPYMSYPVSRKKAVPYQIIRRNRKYDIVHKLFPWFRKTGVTIDLPSAGGKWPTRFITDHNNISMPESKE